MSVVDATSEGPPAHLRPTSWRRSRVPAEHRLFGLDRRTFRWALPVIAVALLWAVVLPAINDRVAYDDPVRPGERFAVSADLAITPPVGWNVQSGLRVTDDTALGEADPIVVTSGGVTVLVLADSFSGTADELLDQVDKVTTTTGAAESFHVTGERTSMTTDSGLVGVAEGFTALRTQGVVVAFVDDGLGVEIQVVGASDQVSTLSDEVVAMVDSLGPRSGDDDGSSA